MAPGDASSGRDGPVRLALQASGILTSRNTASIEPTIVQEPPETMATIIYTHTDEAPLLATYSFLPIIQAYAAKAGVEAFRQL